MKRRARLSRAASAAVALAGFLAAEAGAAPLSLDDVAGKLNGEPVSLREVNDVLDGAAGKSWGEIDQIVRQSGRALCVERAIERRARRQNTDGAGLLAGLWSRAAPGIAAVDEALRRDPGPADQQPQRRRAIEHSLRVGRYRQAIEDEAAGELGDSFQWVMAPTREPLDAEPPLPATVARCLGEEISGAEVEAFAAFPLYRRRAGLVAAVCRQFTIDYANPLLLRRAAAARGMSVEELLRSAEDHSEVADADVRAAAQRRYGDVGAAALAKARLALTAQRRIDGRLRLVEDLRRNGSGECRLARPAPPRVQVRGAGPPLGPAAGLRVSYFGAFRCEHCADGWAALLHLRERWGEQIRIEYRHHFPATALAAFEDAVAAACAYRQERFWDYARWRFAAAGGDVVQALRLDAELYRRCLADPATAVSVLSDAEEGMRLGFREAVPSWVIGSRPRRGFQGDRILDATVRSELAARQAAGSGTATAPARDGAD